MTAAAKTKSPMPQRDLQRELAAAAALKEHLRAVLPDMQDSPEDALVLTDTIEGETSLFETIDAVLMQIALDEANIDGIEIARGKLTARKSRLEKRSELMRTMLAVALETCEQKKFERPLATLTLKAVAPKLVITNEAEIPSQWWRPADPALDRKGLTDAIKARIAAFEAVEAEREAHGIPIDARAYQDALARAEQEHPAVPGADLGNGGATVQIRFQ